MGVSGRPDLGLANSNRVGLSPNPADVFVPIGEDARLTSVFPTPVRLNPRRLPLH